MAGSQAGLPPGVKKEITRHPPSLRHLPPQDGDEVELHYTLKLKAGEREVDSSKERGQAFTYKVGHTTVIEGWALGVKTMRKGEHARFTIAPPLAYGADGNSELEVPPACTVILEVELLKCPSREDLFEDGGAVKLEVKDAPNGRHPRQGDEVQMTYKVSVQGAGVIMQQNKAVYKLGGSEQIGPLAKVVDKALLGMKRGDEAVVTCQPQYTFAAGQHAGKVAMVSISLEEIFEVHDMSVGQRDKMVLRKRIKEGDDTDRIHEFSPVRLDVLSVSAGGEKVISEKRELSFSAGEGAVCDALEGSVIGLRKGDEAVLRCESVEACQGGLLELPSAMEMPIMIHIAVTGFDKAKEKWDLTSAERLERGRARKETAAGLFKRGRVRLAAQHYEHIADLFAKLDFFAAEEQNDAAELGRVANSNRAMCMLKLGNMKSVKELCTSVLSEDTANPKALFRRAKASVALGEYPEAIADLERLLEVEPASRDGRELLREAKRLRRQSDSHESFTFAKMCGGLGDMPERMDRRDDELVQMPDLDAEFAKLAAQHNLPIHPPTKTEEQAAEPAEAAGAAAGADAGADATAGGVVAAPPEGEESVTD